MKDVESKNKFVELRASGWSFERIAAELSVSKQTLINWSKALSVDIANMKALKMDALREKCLLTKQKRMEMFGKSLSKIDIELEKRDFSDIPTRKLLDMANKLYNSQKEDLAGEVILREETALAEFDFKTFKNTWKV